MKRRYKKTVNTKGGMYRLTERRLRWIAINIIVCLKTYVSLTFFQSSLLLFVTFDIMLLRYICLTRGCDFVIHKLFLKFHSK